MITGTSAPRYDLSHLALRPAETGVRERYPKAGDLEIQARLAATHLPPELVKSAYAWDPDAAPR